MQYKKRHQPQRLQSLHQGTYCDGKLPSATLLDWPTFDERDL